MEYNKLNNSANHPLNLAFLGFMAFAVLMPTFHLTAKASDIFTVKNIRIDKTEKNAVVAQEKAMEEATRTAFDILAKRLLSEMQYASFELPEDQILNSFVSDFEIGDEQLSATRYLADFTFRFDPENVRRFFDGGGNEIEANVGDILPVLVLPFYQDGMKMTFWQEPNPWKVAWGLSGKSSNIVPVRIPLGDITDVGLANAKDILLGGDIEPLRRLMQRYETKSAVIVLAENKESENKVAFSIFEFIAEDIHKIRTWDVVKVGDGQSVWQQGQKSVHDFLYQRWKKQMAIQSVIIKSVQIKAKFSSMKEWVKIKKKMKTSGLFEKTELLSLNKNGAFLNVKMKGDAQKMRMTLANLGVLVSRPVVGMGRFSNVSPAYVLELSSNYQNQGVF